MMGLPLVVGVAAGFLLGLLVSWALREYAPPQRAPKPQGQEWARREYDAWPYRTDW